jgi:hypothetical protein
MVAMQTSHETLGHHGMMTMPDRLTEAQIASIAELRAEGLSHQQIVVQTGISKSRVAHYSRLTDPIVHPDRRANGKRSPQYWRQTFGMPA